MTAQRATTTIPIVAAGGDLLGIGVVKSLARPEGNMTGITNLNTDLSPKLLELLLTAVPKHSRLAVLWNPSNSNRASLTNLQTAAKRMSESLILVEAQSPSEIENAFAQMGREHAGAVIVLGDAFFLQQRRQISEQATKYRLPCISTLQEFAEAGVLMTYGRNVANSFRYAATYVDKILKGAKPGELPIEQPTQVELVVNLKTAKALGLTIPNSLLIRADRIIE